jgi:hypothetical protein
VLVERCRLSATSASVCAPHTPFARAAGEWSDCSVVLQNLPIKGRIEVWVVVLKPKDFVAGFEGFENTGDYKGAHPMQLRSITPVVFEGTSLKVYSCPQRGAYELSRDSLSLSNTDNTLCSSRLLTPSQHRKIVGDCVLMRVARWSHRGVTTGLLEWNCKLSCQLAIESLEGTMALQLPRHDSLGYEWFVTVLRAEGSHHFAGSDVCFGLDPPEEPPLEALSDERGDPSPRNSGRSPHTASNGNGSSGLGRGRGTGAESKAADRICEAWSWRPCALRLTGMRCNDRVVLYARPVSTHFNYPAGMLAKCQGATPLRLLAARCSSSAAPLSHQTFVKRHFSTLC